MKPISMIWSGLTALQTVRYVNLRNYFDNSHEEIYYTSPDGWMCIRYRSQLITH